MFHIGFLETDFLYSNTKPVRDGIRIVKKFKYIETLKFKFHILEHVDYWNHANGEIIVFW